MSTTIDNRIVSMEFDNKKFEKNVEESLHSLKSIDKAVDGLVGSSKAFDGVNFNKLAENVDYVKDKFTLMGSITRKVFDDIADSIVSTGEKLVKSMSIDQVTAGWSKYEEKSRSVATIMSATGDSVEKVEAQMEKLNWYTDETSYNFTDMTNNIAKFTAQNIPLEEATVAMQGISNWAASAGQNAQVASRAMYNISQAMGVGAMKYADWKSIELANMATTEFKENALAAAVAVGTLVEEEGHLYTASGKTEVSIENFGSTLSEGWFDIETMMKVFDVYGGVTDILYDVAESTGLYTSELLDYVDAFKKGSKTLESDLRLKGFTDEQIKYIIDALAELSKEEYEVGINAFRAGQEARTFSDAMGAGADAASTAWMNLFQTIFGNVERSKKLWTDFSEFLFEMFAGPVNSINESFEEAFLGDDVIGKLTTKIESAGISMEEFKAESIKAAKEFEIDIDAMIDEAGSFEKSITKFGWLSAGVFKRTTDRMSKTTQTTVKSTETTLAEYKDVVQAIFTGQHNEWYRNGKLSETLVEEAGYNYETVAHMLRVVQRAGFDALKISDLGEAALSDSTLKAMGYTEEQIEQLRKLGEEAGDANSELSALLADTMNQGESGQEIFIQALENFMANILDLSSLVKGAWEDVFPNNLPTKIYNFVLKLRDLSESLAIITEVNGEKVKTVFGEKLTSIFKGLFSALSIAKKLLTPVFTIGKGVVSIFGALAGKVFNASASFGDWLTHVNEVLSESELLGKVNEKISKWFEKLSTSMFSSKVFKGFSDFTKSLKRLRMSFDTLIKTGDIKHFFDNVKIWFNTSIKSSNTYKNAIQKLSDVYGSLKDKAISLWQAFKNLEIINTITSWLSEKLGPAWEKIKTLINGVKEAIGGIFPSFEELKTEIGDLFKKKEDRKNIFDTLRERLTKLKDSIKNSNTYKNAIQKLSDVYGSLRDKAISLWKAFKNLEIINTITSWLSEKLSPAWEKIKPLIDGVKEAIGGIFPSFEELKTEIGDLFKKKEDKKNIFDTLRERLTKLKDSISLLPDVFSKFFNSINLSKVIGLVGVGGLLFGLLKFGKKIIGVINPFKKLKDTIKNFFSTATDALEMFKKAQAASILLKFATAIGILAISIKMLSTIDTGLGRSFFTVVGLIAAFAGALVLLAFAVKKFGVTNIGGAAAVFTAMATSIAILVGSLLVLNFMPINKGLIAKAAALGILIIALGGVAVAMANLTKDGKKMRGGLALIGFAVSVRILVGALAELSDMPLKNVINGMLKVALIFTILGVITRLTSKATLKSSLGIIAFVVAINLITSVLKKFSKSSGDLSGVYGKVGDLLKIAGILVVLSIMMRIGNANFFKLGKKGGAGLGILGFIGGIFLLILALKKLNELYTSDGGNLKKSLKILVILGLIVAGMMVAASLLGKMKEDSVNAIIAVIIGIVSIIGTVMLLSLFTDDYASLIKSTVIIAAICLALAFSLKIATSNLGKVDGAGLAKIIVAVVGALLVVAGLCYAIMIVSENANESALDAAKTIALTLIGISVSMALMGAAIKFMDGIGFGESLKTLGVLAIAIVGAVALMIGIGWAAQALEAYDIVGKIETAGEILIIISSILGYAIGAFIGSIGTGLTAQLQPIADNFKSFVSTLSSFEISDAATENIAALGAILLELAGAEFLYTIPSIIAALGGDTLSSEFTKITTAFSTLVTNLSGLTVSDGIESQLDSLGKLLGILSAENFKNNLSNIATGLLSNIFGTQQSTDLSTLLTNISEPLKTFNNSISESDMDTEKITLATDVVKAISTLLRALPREGGVLEWFTGSKWDGLSDNFGLLAQGIEAFCDTAGTINSGHMANITARMDTFQKIIGLANDLGKHGGIKQAFTGDSMVMTQNADGSTEYINYLGQTLTGFADGLEYFVNKADTIENAEEKIKKVQPAIDSIIAIGEAIPTTGGWLDAITGNNDADTFGGKMVAFLDQVGEYCSKAADFDDSDITDSNRVKKIIESMASAADTIIGTDVSIWDNTTVFGTKLKELVPYIKTFVQDINGLDGIDNAVEVLETFNTAVGASIPETTPSIPEVEKATEVAEAETDMWDKLAELKKIASESIPSIPSIEIPDIGELISETGFGDYLDPNKWTAMASEDGGFISGFLTNLVGKGFKFDASLLPPDLSPEKFFDDFMGYISGKVDVSSLEGYEGFDFFSVAAGMFENTDGADTSALGEGFMSYFKEGMNSIKEGDTENVVGAFVDETLVPSINEKISGITESMSTLGTSISESLMSGLEEATKNVSDILSTIRSKMDRAAHDMRLRGQYVGQGFADGINSKWDAVHQAALNLCAAATESITYTFKISSPSKLTTQYGAYVGEGLAIGMRSETANVAQSATMMALGAVSAIDQASASIVETNLGAQLSGQFAAALASAEENLEDEGIYIPVIVDTDPATKALSSLNGIVSSTSASMAAKASPGNASSIAENQNGSTAAGASYNFIQNNYSPKAVDRTTIYRQSKGLISSAAIAASYSI